MQYLSPLLHLQKLLYLPPLKFNHSALRDVVLQNTGVELLLESVSCYLTGYLLLSRSTEDATRILSAPFIHIGEHALALTPWTPGCGATEIPCDEQLPQQRLAPARCPRSPQNRVRLHLVISGLPLHLFAQSQLVLPRVFANICQLVDVERDTSEYSLRANTIAELESIPRGIYVGIRKVGQSGPYVQLWPVWIQPYHLPPADPQAIEQHGNGNCSNNRTLLRLCYTISSNDCRSYCRSERSSSPIMSLPTTRPLPGCGAFWTRRCTRTTTCAIMYGSTSQYITLITYLRTQTIHKQCYLMWILMQV